MPVRPARALPVSRPPPAAAPSVSHAAHTGALHAGAEPRERPDGWRLPGTRVKVPPGYFAAGALLVLAVLVIGYMLGYNWRKVEERRDTEAQVARDLDRTVDPLVQLPVNQGLVQGAQPRQAQQPPSPGPSRPAGPSGSTGGSSAAADRSRIPGVVIVERAADDPRQKDLNYLVVATLPEDEAEKAATFLASNGLSVGIAPTDGRSTQRWVFIVRGFGPKEWYAPEGKALEEQIKSLGREYQAQTKGPPVFRDPWWKKHGK